MADAGIEMQYRPNMGLLYGRLRQARIVLVIMLAMFSVAWQAEAKVDINTADKEELDSLPEIGPVLAQRIIDYRQQYGCFLDIHEIMNVKGIGQKTFEDIEDRIEVTIPSSPCDSSWVDREASKNRVRENVEEIKRAMDEFQLGKTTIAVAEVYVCCSPPDGRVETWVSNAGQDHNINQKILDAAGINTEEVAYPDLGDGMENHAEMGLLRKAQMDQVCIISIWATREICEDCANNLREAGFDDDFVNPPCNVGLKDKLPVMWGEIKNSVLQ